MYQRKGLQRLPTASRAVRFSVVVEGFFFSFLFSLHGVELRGSGSCYEQLNHSIGIGTDTVVHCPSLTASIPDTVALLLFHPFFFCLYFIFLEETEMEG